MKKFQAEIENILKEIDSDLFIMHGYVQTECNDAKEHIVTQIIEEVSFNYYDTDEWTEDLQSYDAAHSAETMLAVFLTIDRMMQNIS